MHHADESRTSYENGASIIEYYYQNISFCIRERKSFGNSIQLSMHHTPNHFCLNLIIAFYFTRFLLKGNTLSQNLKFQILG